MEEAVLALPAAHPVGAVLVEGTAIPRGDMRAARRRVDDVGRAGVPVVAVLLGLGDDEAARRAGAGRGAVIQVVRVAVVTLLVALDDAVSAPARGRPSGGRLMRAAMAAAFCSDRPAGLVEDAIAAGAALCIAWAWAAR